ncbi:MAG: S8 family serine peptidase [Verrucomicrobiota bacterium]
MADYGGFRVLEVNAAAARTFDGNPAVENRDEDSRIRLNAGDVDTTAADVRAARRPAAMFKGRRLHLVQFAGPIKPAWYDELTAAGVRVVSYIPHNAYLVYGEAGGLARIHELGRTKSHVQWDGAFLDDDKIQPQARRRLAKAAAQPEGDDLFAVQLVADPEANAATLKLIDALQLAPVMRQDRVLDYVNVIVRLPPDQVPAVAAQPDVVSIESYVMPRKMDERQDQIVAGNLIPGGSGPTGPGYLNWLAARGFTQSQFTASGFAVDVADSGVDNGTNRPNHFALYVAGDTGQASRVVYNRLEGTPHAGSTLAGCDGHGTINAHIISGYDNWTNFPHTDSTGYRYGLGVCPFVKVGSSVIFDPDTFTSPNYNNMMSRAYRDGARISSESWGAAVAGDYNSDCQAYDALVRDAQPAGSAVPSNGNQQMVIVFSAGNAGPGSQTVGSPGTAKNVITVGAGENVHSHSTTNGGNNTLGNDACSVPDTGADNANDIIDFSSRGPCADGRKKPDIVAPGTHITGGAPQDSPPPSPAGTGNDLACYDSSGVCALPGSGAPGDPDNFFPTNQQFFTTSSGTSHSTPAVAGGCALIRQYFINLGLNAPSPAMTKAFLLNATRYMTGASANDTLWSNSQGMGGMNLGLAFDGTPRILRDQLTNDTFTASGQARLLGTTISDTSKPVRVTLAWTDAPGSTSGNAYKNDLDLTVVIGGRTYKGNVFSGATSTTGGAADVRDNVESVFLPAGTTGNIEVTVSAANINSDGVPNYGGALDQDFALVICNVVTSNRPPMLGPIGENRVTVSNLLQFAVSASDLVDGDAITLGASNVPPWTVFSTVTNAGTVTSTFSGTPPYRGVYVTTFYAADKDGADSETVTVTVNGVRFPTNLLSEDFDLSTNVPPGWINGGTVNDTGVQHVQSPPNCRALGIGDSLETPAVTYPTQLAFYADANPLGDGRTATVDYKVNGGSWIQLGTLVVSKSGGSFAFALDGSPDLSFATNVSFRFNSSFNTWYLDDVRITGLTAEQKGVPPVLSAVGDKAVVVGHRLQFAVTATPTEGNPVTLSVSNAPAGSVLSSTNEYGSLIWTNPPALGVSTATFYAADVDGVDFEAVRITVAAPGPGNGATETFSSADAPLDAYGSGSYLGDGNVMWTYSGLRKTDAGYYIDGPSVGFGASNADPREIRSSAVPGGVGDLSVKYLEYFPGVGARGFDVYVNGGLVGSVSGITNVTPEVLMLSSINTTGDVIVRIVGTGQQGCVIDTLAWTPFAGYDTNTNGIRDTWEIQHFGNLTNSAGGDNDGDGCDNLCEYLADTDPLSSNSVFKIEALWDATNSTVFFWSTNSRLYTVLYATDLTAGATWNSLESGLAGSNGYLSVSDTNEVERRYYRARVTLP